MKTLSKEENNYPYIEDDVFRKMTKAEKLEMKEYTNFIEHEINRLVIMPSNEKFNGYKVGHFFAYTNDKGWWRSMTYDCWSIITDIENPAKLRYQILRGDFENGGFQIFEFMDEHHKAFISYAGTITIKKK